MDADCETQKEGRLGSKRFEEDEPKSVMQMVVEIGE
jgi:hypothetical protein